MLYTPDRFLPLLTPPPDTQARLFVFHPEGVMLSDANKALPGEAECADMVLVDGRVHTVGMLDGVVYR